MVEVTAFGGWLLRVSADIDLEHPGFLGHLLRCGSERRHVIAAYLSRERPMSVFSSASAVGAFLTEASHDAILEAAFGDVPHGLRSALGRAGNQPYSRRYYAYLYSLLSSASRPEMRFVIRHLTRVNPTRLKLARCLPREARTARLVETLRHLPIARDINRLVVLMSAVGLDRTAMITALGKITSEEQVSAWAFRWASKLPLPEHPVPSAPFYSPIQNASDLQARAREFRNCMGGYITTVLERESAFAVITAGVDEAVVHLVRSHGCWTLEDVYAPRNRSPSSAITAKAQAYLRDHGIANRPEESRSSREWACLRRLTRAYDHHHDWDIDEVVNR